MATKGLSMLAKNKGLRYLDLGLNSLGHEEARALALILAKTRSNALETLCLSHNSFSDKGAVELASALADCFGIRGGLNAVAIGVAPERPRIAALDLSANRITAVGAYNFITGLLKCANELVNAHKMSATRRKWKPLQLDALVLAENPIGPKGAALLSAALRTRWETDDERMVRVTKEAEEEKKRKEEAQGGSGTAAAAQADLKQAATCLAEEEKESNEEGTEDTISIVGPSPPRQREVRPLLEVGTLDLSGCGIEASGAKEIAEAAPALRSLFLSGNRIGCEVSRL